MFEGYLDGSLVECLKARADEVLDHDGGLTADEVAVTAVPQPPAGDAIRPPRRTRSSTTPQDAGAKAAAAAA